MNRRHNPSSEISHLVADVRRMTADEILETHGIEIDIVDNTVYDATYEKTFKNVNEWARFVVEQESDMYDEEDDKYSSEWNEDE